MYTTTDIGSRPLRVWQRVLLVLVWQQLTAARNAIEELVDHQVDQVE